MMKGRKGGYVLVYVLIVIVIVSALGLAVCSASLRNLQVQAAAVHQMNDKYTAEGEIERFCAWLLKLEVTTPLKDKVVEYSTLVPGTSVTSVTVDPTGSSLVTVTAKSNSVKVTAELEVITAGSKVVGINYTSYAVGTSGA